MAPSGDSTLARIQTARQNEQLVLAESSVRGAAVIAWVRFGMMFGIGLAQAASNWLAGQTPMRDPFRGLLVAAYTLFALALALMYRTIKPNPARATRAQAAILFTDLLFVGALYWRNTVVEREVPAQVLALALALVLCLHVVSYHRLQLYVATGLSIASYLALSAAFGTYDFRQSGFVCGSLAAIGALMIINHRRTGRMFLELRRRDNLSRFLSPEVAERVMQLGEAELQPVQREVTVLFSDIRSFTAMSERMLPREVLGFLDDYFAQMTQVVKGHHGVVNKFIGDGMMAVWGVPERSEDHALDAVRAAQDMLKVVREMNDARLAHGQAPFEIGIGIHTGAVAAGMMGGADQHEYTVIGDAVNVASRVEGLTKPYGVKLLLTDTTWAKVRDRVQGAFLASEEIRGRKEPVELYMVDV
ncbi:MAG TPA: adenylate/guanylate cyclase domain-containing protein [Myxococcales bacterium]|nr:adenylate/guanylate cyclase domain-containing protein [Myxococcales bacterium]